MKKSILAFLFLAIAISPFAQSPVVNDYKWFANDHFEVQNENGLTSIMMKKKAWEAFTLKVFEVDFSEKSTLSFKIKSNESITLRVDVIDGSNQNKTIDPIIKQVSKSNDFTVLEYDFKAVLTDVDRENISHFHFWVNPGSMHSGSVWIKDVVINEPQKEVVSNPKKILVYPNPVKDRIIVNTELMDFDAVKIYDYTGRAVMQTTFSTTTKKEINIEVLSEGIFKILLFKKGAQVGSTSIVK